MIRLPRAQIIMFVVLAFTAGIAVGILLVTPGVNL